MNWDGLKMIINCVAFYSSHKKPVLLSTSRPEQMGETQCNFTRDDGELKIDPQASRDCLMCSTCVVDRLGCIILKWLDQKNLFNEKLTLYESFYNVENLNSPFTKKGNIFASKARIFTFQPLASIEIWG